MKYLHHVAVLAFLCTSFAGLVGCDAAGSPVAVITGIDVAAAADDQFIEIQDVAGRAYVRVDSFPATVDVSLWSEARDYFIVLIETTQAGYAVAGVSNSFKATDLSGTSFTTGGGVEAVLSLE